MKNDFIEFCENNGFTKNLHYRYYQGERYSKFENGVRYDVALSVNNVIFMNVHVPNSKCKNIISSGDNLVFDFKMNSFDKFLENINNIKEVLLEFKENE